MEEFVRAARSYSPEQRLWLRTSYGVVIERELPQHVDRTVEFFHRDYEKVRSPTGVMGNWFYVGSIIRFHKEVQNGTLDRRAIADRMAAYMKVPR
jgi:hypothetical protein